MSTSAIKNIISRTKDFISSEEYAEGLDSNYSLAIIVGLLVEIWNENDTDFSMEDLTELIGMIMRSCQIKEREKEQQ